jgi:nucleotide exchange factor SIL1
VRDIVDDGDANPSEKSNLRSYQELQDALAENKMKLNTEFEQISVLVEHFGNSSTAQRVLILEDLEYYLHQSDNADDFAAFGGLESVVRPALEAVDETEIRARAAILLGSSMQNQPKVQVWK